MEMNQISGPKRSKPTGQVSPRLAVQQLLQPQGTTAFGETNPGDKQRGIGQELSQLTTAPPHHHGFGPEDKATGLPAVPKQKAAPSKILKGRVSQHTQATTCVACGRSLPEGSKQCGTCGSTDIAISTTVIQTPSVSTGQGIPQSLE